MERSQQRDQRAVIQAREREYEAAMQAAMAAARQAAAAREASEAETRKNLEQEARQELDAQLQERAELQRVARVRAPGRGCLCLWVLRGMRASEAGGRAADSGPCSPSNCHLHCHFFGQMYIPALPILQEEFEKERAAVDAVVARIEEEERAAEEARARQRQMAQADIARFLAQQQELRQRCGCLAAGHLVPRCTAASTAADPWWLRPTTFPPDCPFCPACSCWCAPAIQSLTFSC